MGNLQKVLTVKINARVMITTNIDVTDGLTNGAMGTVTNVVIDQTTGEMSVILVAFHSEHVGQETRYTSVYNSRNQNAVPIPQTQATFPVHKKTSFQATRTRFPLTLAWAVTIHKCQRLTLSEIVIDMTCAKGKFKLGEAYVAFSRVKTLDKFRVPLIREKFDNSFQSGNSGKNRGFQAQSGEKFDNQGIFQPARIVFANHVFFGLGRVRLSGFLSMSGAGLSCI